VAFNPRGLDAGLETLKRSMRPSRSLASFMLFSMLANLAEDRQV